MITLHRTSLIFILCISILSSAVRSEVALAQPSALVPGVNEEFIENSLFRDNNGSGAIEIIAFGDSITRGVGDFLAPNQNIFQPTQPHETGEEAGYPRRLESLLKVGVSNRGEPGEDLVTRGIHRYIDLIRSNRPDIIVISEGANDARDRVPSGVVANTFQTMLNIAYASGVTPVLWTTPVPCCGHLFLAPYVAGYNSEISRLGAINGVRVGRANHGFENTCGSVDCMLLNRPEGLHPNSAGYDCIAENIIAALLGIDIFAVGGAAEIERALNLPAGTIKTPPDPVPTPAPNANATT